METEKRQLKARHGSILVLAIIMVAVLLIIGLALIRLGLNSRLQAVRSQLVISAKAAADAGMTKAIEKMRDAFNKGASMPVGSESGVTAGSNPPATYTYTITGGSTSWDVNSTGTVSGVQRTVHCKLAITPIPAIAVQNEIWLQTTDFPCTITMQTNSTERAAVTLKAGLTVNGDVVCGPGGDPRTAIDTKDRTIINGYTYAADEPVPFPAVEVPPPFWTVSKTAYIHATDANVSGDKWWGPTTIDIQDLTIIGPCRIFIEGGQLTLGNNKSIIVNPGGSLELYLDGNFEGKNSMGFENLTNDATKLKIQGTENCTFINLKAKSASLACAIYAPSADVSLFNSANIFGTVAANSFTMKLGGSFCSDPNSARYTLDPAQGSWWEE
jgi:hypothetical protein